MVSFPVVQSKLSSGAGFSQGETLVFKAVRSLGGSLWQVSHKGRRFVIRSELALKVGARYHTRVHRVGTTATLRLTPDLPGRSETPTGILIAPGSNENTLARTLFHAMQSVRSPSILVNQCGQPGMILQAPYGLDFSFIDLYLHL